MVADGSPKPFCPVVEECKMSEGELVPLAPGVLAWIDPRPGRPFANCGIVLDDDAITAVDALAAPSLAEAMLAQLAPTGLNCRRLVLTSSHVEYTGGSQAFTMAGVYGSAVASENLDLPPNIAGYQRRFPEHAVEYAELQARAVTHRVDEGAYLSPAAIAVPTSGQQFLNLVVQVPTANVVFAGAMCSFGETPLAFDGDPAAWADALDAIMSYGEVIVPGHGPVGGHDQVRDLQAYLRACVDGSIPSGPWDSWSGREWDQVNIERAAMLAVGDHNPPPSMLAALGLG